MRIGRAFTFVVVASSLLRAAPCAARTADAATPYGLITPPSSLQVGCQGPCACPIDVLPTYGSFELVKTGVDPLYTYYAVQRFIASFNNGPGAVAITGSGVYKVGGEFAAMQQMTLDLDINGQSTQHFDSGLEPVNAPFPRIEISCAVHGFHCFDSVLVVNAKPAEPSGIPPAQPPGAGLRTLRPNPFVGETTIAFALDRPGSVDLAILDLEGRRVRTLMRSRVTSTNEQTTVWDGRRDDGRAAAAGVYWVELRRPGAADRRRIVKLN